MSDYAAVPVQPIAQALLTIDAAGDPQISGRGFSSVTRATGVGDFLLTFAQGIGVADIGSGSVSVVNGSAVPGFGFTDGRSGPNGLNPRFARVSTMMRAGTTAPGATLIVSRMATFTSVPGQGATQLRMTLRNVANALTDPMGAGAPNATGGGLEIMVWSTSIPDDNAQKLVGPLFQGAMQFP
jgi:hypothetical protein